MFWKKILIFREGEFFKKNAYKIYAASAGFTLLIIISVVMSASFGAITRIDEAVEARRQTFLLIDKANDLMSDLVDAETGQRGFLLTNDEAFLSPYHKARENIGTGLKELGQLTMIGEAYSHIDAITPMIKNKLEFLEYNIELRRHNSMEIAVANIQSSEGKFLMDSIRTEMLHYIKIEKNELDEDENIFRSEMSSLFATILTGSLFAILLVLAIAYMIYRETKNKIRKVVHLETKHLLDVQSDINKQLQQTNNALQISEEKLIVTLISIGDGVMATDIEGNVTILNPCAEELTGWTQSEAAGRPSEEVFRIINEDNREPVASPVKDTLTLGTKQLLLNHTVLISRTGSECAIADSCSPIRDREGKVVGTVMVFRDVTEKRDIENGLEKARKELAVIKQFSDEATAFAENIINTVRESLIVLDQDLRVVSASRSFYEFFKVSIEDTVGHLVYELGNRQWDIPKLRELLEDILPQKSTFNDYEVEHDFLSIGRRTMLLNARQIPSLPDKPKVILLAIEDITERKEIEAGLEKTRKELEIIKKTADEASEYSESIINTVREPLIALDQDLRVVSVSRSFYEFFKVNPEDTIGQLIYDLGNKQWDIPKLRELLETILPQKTTFDNYEVVHDFATIGRRIMLLNARQIERGMGKERIILLAIEDITERKEIEAGLEKTRKELEIIKKTADEASEYSESIINTVREPLIALDQDLRVVSVSRSFYEFFKVNPEDTIGQLIYDLGNKQWNIPKLRELLETILPQKTTFDNYEVEHDFATIGRRIMLLNARQIERVLGMERIILLAIEDITERKEIEAGLENANKELNELATELKRVAHVKSEFLANMSHELRTPLNSINGFSEVLYDETFGVLNEKQKKYVNNVLISGRHLLLLINQILDMAKVEAGKMKLALSVLPTKSVLNEISMLVADMVSKKKLQMVTEIADDLPEIEADELKVKEIIYNLLSNAVKFTPEGGHIGMKAKKNDSEIEIEVWDTGVGIAIENIEKIFEGFFRVDTPYSRVTEGTGLGLPLSKKLVELHGGSLYIESEGLNKGTKVRFTLPIVSAEVML